MGVGLNRRSRNNMMSLYMSLYMCQSQRSITQYTGYPNIVANLCPRTMQRRAVRYFTHDGDAIGVEHVRVYWQGELHRVLLAGSIEVLTEVLQGLKEVKVKFINHCRQVKVINNKWRSNYS